MLDALLATGLLPFLFAKRPPGPLAWPWLVALSILGGLGFGIQFYLWLNFKRSGEGPGDFSAWWRTV